MPLEDVPRLLLAADVHLITLRDAFVGYVLPSKIHACIESGKRIVFVGSANSDVHLLASQARPSGGYHRVNPGDVTALVKVLHEIERELMSNAVKTSGSQVSGPEATQTAVAGHVRSIIP